MTEQAAQIDPRTFRRTVGQFATGVTVITVAVNGDVRAMTANSFTSLSLDPPLVLFCVGKTTQMGRAIHDASHFTVSILSESQQRLSTYFAGGWKESEPPPFALESWSGGHRLEGCVAAVGCAVETIYEGGDHWIVVGRVLALHGADQACAPLLFCRGQYAKLHEATS
jgi:3-hydroxy-9,10-secoandrosta-1,3,5(10)-triene-9,17-dione monooxygenase reductase component